MRYNHPLTPNRCSCPVGPVQAGASSERGTERETRMTSPSRDQSARALSAALVLAIASGSAGARGDTDPHRLLLVRPHTVESLTSEGLADEQARLFAAQATDRLEGLVERWIPEIGVAVVRTPEGESPSDFAGALSESGLYRCATPNVLCRPNAAAPDDPRFPDQWHLDRIQAPDAWELDTGSPGVVIAVVDTGVDVDHPDLMASLVSGYNAVSRVAQTSGGQVDDLNGHGTAAAGAAAAIGNNGVGGSGVSWSSSIMPVRCSDVPSGSAFLDDIIDGVIWGAQHGAQVTVVGFSGLGSPLVETLGSFVRANGGLLIWGAGNNALSLSFDHPSVIVVGGTNMSDVRWLQSNYGPAIDVVAPASSLVLPALGGTYLTRSGTSFSAPIVAGTAALIYSIAPGIAPEDAEIALLGTVDDLGEPGDDDEFGAGRVNAFRAALFTELTFGIDGGEGEPGNGDGGAEGDEFREPESPSDDVPGVQARYYQITDPVLLPDFDALNVYLWGRETSINFGESTGTFGTSGRSDDFGAVFSGYVHVPATSEYTFFLKSDEGSAMYVGSQLVVAHNGVHPFTEASGTISLKAGRHAFRVEYFEKDGPQGLVMSVQGGGLAKQAVPASMLTFSPQLADFNADGMINLSDLNAFFNAWQVKDIAADVNGDGIVDLTDLLDFMNAWSNA